MPTVINNPGGGTSGDGGMGAGMIIGIVIAIIIVLALIFFYGLPMLRGGAVQPQNPGFNVNVQLPNPTDQGGGDGGQTQGQ